MTTQKFPYRDSYPMSGKDKTPYIEYEYYPTSVKDTNNRPIINNFPWTNSEIFLSKKNVDHMVYYMIALNTKNYTKTDPKITKRKVPPLMKKWATVTEIDDYESLDNNIITNLEFLNKKFLTDNGCLFDIANVNSLNVFQITNKVTDNCNRNYNKKFDEMLAVDYHTIDLHQYYETMTYNKNYRYKNSIPVWQRSMSTRNYDRENDGLRDANPDRASLENQIHGYDMSNIIKGSTYYDNPSYEHL